MIKVNGKPYEWKQFPDGTPLMHFLVDEDTDDIQYRIEWEWECLSEQVILQYLTMHIREKNPLAKITLSLPYVPNGRQDRTQEKHDIFTLKYFADSINRLGFNHVYILDPHSNVSPALLNNVFVNKEKYKKLYGAVMDKCKPDIIYLPDNGAVKSKQEFIDRPYIVGYKDRDWETGKIQGTEILGKSKYNLKDKTVCIIDDISSYGGTFLYAATELKKIGVGKIFLFVTHCENSILEGELIKSGLLDGIYTTRSIFTKVHDLIEVIGG